MTQRLQFVTFLCISKSLFGRIVKIIRIIQIHKSEYGEFDSGSERTLAMRLKHASRAGLFGQLDKLAANW